MRALLAHPPDEVKALARAVAEGCEIRLLRLPQAGLGLLQLTDGALGERWYLGEFPVSCCAVEVVTPQGTRALGAAQVLADDADLAQALAVLDAVAAGGLPGAERVRQCITRGANANRETDARRRSLLAATRVDFALLGQAGGRVGDA